MGGAGTTVAGCSTGGLIRIEAASGASEIGCPCGRLLVRLVDTTNPTTDGGRIGAILLAEPERKVSFFRQDQYKVSGNESRKEHDQAPDNM